VKRREFIAGIAAAAAWPFTARAQPMPVIGFLGLTSFDEWKRYVASFHQGLNEGGFVAGRNVAIEYRWAEGRYEQLALMATDLATRKVDVIVTVAPPAATAAKAATQVIPIVFFMGADPVKLGLITSFNRPGSNITGVSVLANSIGAKRLQLLHEVAPQSSISGFLVNPTNLEQRT
jgi:putative ABC transport system substrate-binding protein